MMYHLKGRLKSPHPPTSACVTPASPSMGRKRFIGGLAVSGPTLFSFSDEPASKMLNRFRGHGRQMKHYSNLFLSSLSMDPKISHIYRTSLITYIQLFMCESTQE